MCFVKVKWAAGILLAEYSMWSDMGPDLLLPKIHNSLEHSDKWRPASCQLKCFVLIRQVTASKRSNNHPDQTVYSVDVLQHLEKSITCRVARRVFALWKWPHVNYCTLTLTVRLSHTCRHQYWKQVEMKAQVFVALIWNRYKDTVSNCLVCMSQWVCMHVLFSKTLAWPALAPPPPKIKNIKTLKQEIWNLKKLSAILFYGGEVDMSAQWDPTSNKDQHFFHCFSFRWRWAWFKDQKSKIASKFWYIYGSVTFFCLSVFFSFFHCVPSASL